LADIAFRQIEKEDFPFLSISQPMQSHPDEAQLTGAPKP